jgi:hypothetical protein
VRRISVICRDVERLSRLLQRAPFNIKLGESQLDSPPFSFLN